ncbi:MAG: TerC family protein [Betaproteobacteria bacterium]
MDISSPQFWIAVLQIILIDILLSGDNAVVIALACRNLPQRQRTLGIFWGVGGAIALRIALTFFAVSLLSIPYLKIVGAVLLLWIGVKLVQPQHDDDGHEIKAEGNLLGAIRTIIIADLVMSLDNVIAVAAAARDSLFLLIFGLTLSIPLMVWASQMILRLMDRFPSIIVLGGALLGWVGLSMAVHDPAIKPWVVAQAPWLNYAAPFTGAVLVVVVGKLLARGARAGAAAEIVDLARDNHDRASSHDKEKT